jgi:hypothetical protein
LYNDDEVEEDVREMKRNSSGSMHLNLHEKFMRECKIEVLFEQRNKIHALRERESQSVGRLEEKITFAWDKNLLEY